MTGDLKLTDVYKTEEKILNCFQLTKGNASPPYYCKELQDNLNT